MSKTTTHTPRILLIGDNQRTVMTRLYLKRDETGQPAETPEECMRRVAHHIAQGEPTPELQAYWEEEFYNMLCELDWSPNSPTYTAAGRPDGMGSACFVLPVPDSIKGIFEAAKRGALVHKEGGGTGYSFDNIRENGSIVKTTNGIASGPISFMETFDAATESIKQGSTR